RSNSRARRKDAHDAPATAPENWQGAPVREPQFAAGDTPRRSAQESSYGSSYATSRDYAQPPASEPADWRAESRVYDEPEHGADQQSQHYDDQTDGGQYDAQEAESAYQDDVPLQPHEHEMYDDAPRARRGGGFATALALIGCAVLGTAGAYAYRSYFGHPSSTQPPPVITAANSTPTKIVPASAGDPQSSNVAQDRPATAPQ